MSARTQFYLLKTYFVKTELLFNNSIQQNSGVSIFRRYNISKTYFNHGVISTYLLQLDVYKEENNIEL